MSSFFRWDENTQFVLPFLDIQQLGEGILTGLSFDIIKIVILDNKINHPGKRQKNKTFVACFLGFLIGKMSIYAECKKNCSFCFWWFFMGKQEMHPNNILSFMYYIIDEQKEIYKNEIQSRLNYLDLILIQRPT